jgi:predicted lysophospholipase L1 biosynthesis ABC-type transport system permease subunit
MRTALWICLGVLVGVWWALFAITEIRLRRRGRPLGDESSWWEVFGLAVVQLAMAGIAWMSDDTMALWIAVIGAVVPYVVVTWLVLDRRRLRNSQ